MPFDQHPDELIPRFNIQKNRITPNSELKKAESVAAFAPDKVIYVELDDEITNVFDDLKRTKGHRIAVVIPKQAVVLQSLINLKILKKKIDEIGKEVLIVTFDKIGRNNAEKVGFATTERLVDKTSASGEKRPLLVSFGQRPVRMAKKKVSIAEVLRNAESSITKGIAASIKDYLKKKKAKQAQHTRIVFSAPNKQALFTLILVSILLFAGIAYIALPGATIYITPRSSMLDPSFNVTFLDYDQHRDFFENNNRGNSIVIPSYKVKPPPFTRKRVHRGTGKSFQGNNAQGIISVVNLSTTPWELASRTRFQTENGIVFRSLRPVKVPQATALGHGKLEIAVVADEFDTLGQPVGQRGNIGPTQFFLPGLKNEENRKKLYGESTAPMTGGFTRIATSVSKEDIVAAAEVAKKEVAKLAIADLKAYLEQQNLSKKTNLTLLSDRNVVKTSTPVISLPEGIEGKALEEFDVMVTYSAESIAYDKQQLLDMLKDRLRSRVDPDKKILKIDEQDLSYRFLDEDFSQGKVRLTATMRALQIYELDPKKENGLRFIKKITDHIVGMRVSEAQEFLQQQTDEIARVSIKTWPIWSPTIPNVSNNIKFVIQEQPDI